MDGLPILLTASICGAAGAHEIVTLSLATVISVGVTSSDVAKWEPMPVASSVDEEIH